jgi:hypothetical protein
LHDSVELEKRGRPVALVITEPFVETARAAAAMAGMPEYGFVVIAHPLARLDRTQIRERAAGAAEAVLRRLLVQPSAADVSMTV